MDRSKVGPDVPHPPRIYDYYLGGTHNFAADREVADAVMRFAPFIPKAIRIQRACLRDIPRELAQRYGLNVIIDFAAGLPTQEHLHQHAPPGMTVIYADIDPYVVEQGRAIIGDRPDVYFFQADMRQPEQLLEHPEVQQILQGKRNVGLITWGILLYFSDEAIRALARAFYNWAGAGACWVCNFPMVDYNTEHPAVIQFLETYRQMNEPLYARTCADCLPLVQPWQPDARGLISFTGWHGLDPGRFMTEEDLEAVGPAGGGYAAFLVK
jgi:hypothetical protein